MRADLIERLIGRLRHRAECRANSHLPPQNTLEWEAADALASQEPVAWRWPVPPHGRFIYCEDKDSVLSEDAQPLFASPVVPVAAPTLDTTISEDTKRALAAIDDNIRAAAAQASTTFVGVPVAAKAEATGEMVDAGASVIAASRGSKYVYADHIELAKDVIDAALAAAPTCEGEGT